MPTVYALLPEPKRAFLDSNGDPASGYQLFIYIAGSSTKATTYTESDGNTANSNPVVLNSRGEPPSGIYVESGTYKMVLATDTDTDPPSSAIWTRDNVSPINDTSTTVDQFTSSGLTPTFVGSTSFTLVGDQRSTFHIGRRLKTSNSGGTGYHTITNSTFSSPNTTVTVANDSTALDSGLSSVSLSILTADSTGSLPGVEVSEDDWTHQGNVTVEGTLAGTGAATLSSTLAVTGVLTAGTAPLPRSWLAGLALSNDTDTDHDIAIAVGAARDDSDAADLRLDATLTKQIDASWAVGDNAGGLDGSESVAGTPDNNTWYSVWLIRRSDTGVVDALFSESATAPTMPTNYDQKRRIGWVKTNGSGNIYQFIQTGERFIWTDPNAIGLDESDFALSTAEQTITLDFCPPSVEAIMNAGVTGTEAAYAWIYETGVTSAAVGETATMLPNLGSRNTSSGQTNTHIAEVRVGVDASRQIHARGIGTHTLDIQMIGWIDCRGRDD